MTDEVDYLLQLASLATSVGYSQLWCFLKIKDTTLRKPMRNIFEAASSNALNDYAGEQAKLCARPKLEGFDQVPVQLAVFVDKKHS